MTYLELFNRCLNEINESDNERVELEVQIEALKGNDFVVDILRAKLDSLPSEDERKEAIIKDYFISVGDVKRTTPKTEREGKATVKTNAKVNNRLTLSPSQKDNIKDLIKASKSYKTISENLRDNESLEYVTLAEWTTPISDEIKEGLLLSVDSSLSWYKASDCPDQPKANNNTVLDPLLKAVWADEGYEIKNYKKNRLGIYPKSEPSVKPASKTKKEPKIPATV